MGNYSAEKATDTCAEKEPYLVEKLLSLRHGLSYSHELVNQIAERVDRIKVKERGDKKECANKPVPDYVGNLQELVESGLLLNNKLEYVLNHLSEII